MATLVWQWRGRFTVALVGLIALVLVVGQTRFTAIAGDPYSVAEIVDTNPDPNIVEVTITAEAAAIDIGGGVIAQVLTFNGTVPGPLFRLQVGNEVIVHFTNNIAHATGIHWHGIELNNASDGTPLTQGLVPPGDSYLYKFKVVRPGLFWYHPHHHSSTNQVFKGMYGPIVVDDPNEAALIGSGVLPTAAQTLTLALSDLTVCKPAGTNDATTYQLTQPHVSGALSAQQPPFPVTLCETAPIDEDGNPRAPFVGGEVPNIQKAGTSGAVNEGQVVITNGVNVGGRAGTPAAPGALAAGAFTFDVQAGQGLRMQIGNTATTRFFRLRLTDSAGVQIPLVRVGGQGGILDSAVVEGGVVAGFDFKYGLGEVLLDPGDRMDVVAAIPATASGVLTMWTQDFQRTGAGFSNIPTVPVAHFNVVGVAPAVYTIANGTPLRASIPGQAQEVLGPATATLLDPGAFVPAKPGLPGQDVQLTNAGNLLGVNLIQGHHDFPGPYTGVPHEGSARYAKLGDTLELTVTNVTGAHHPFHLHGFSIQPIEFTKPASPSFTFPTHEFRDNIDIPAGYTLRYRVRIDDRPLMDGTTPGGGRGRWVFHCHIFFHAVFGMISEFVVADADGKERPYVNANDTLIEALTGQNVQMLGTFVDTDGEAVTLSASIGTVTDTGGGTWKWEYTTAGGEAPFVFITATDAGGRKDQSAFKLEVNAPPAVTVNNAAGNEGSAIPIHATAVDPDGDPVTTTWTFTPGVGVDAGATCVIAAPAALDTTIACTDDGTFTLTLTASDGLNAPVSKNAVLTVANVAPTIAVTSPPSGSVFKVGTTVAIVASIADPGANDVLKCTYLLDGGGPTSTVAPAGGLCTRTNKFTRAGVFTVKVIGSDDDGGIKSALVVIVVFDPDFEINGKGSIKSPAGALVANPSRTGKAEFAFDVKYYKHQQTPTGDVDFEFKVGDFEFDSRSLEYLVVAGNKAQVKGTGKVNNAGNFGFLMTVADSKQSLHGHSLSAWRRSPDKFRIKIFNKSAGNAVVYDNVPGAPDDIDVANPQPISSGNVVIRNNKDKHW